MAIGLIIDDDEDIRDLLKEGLEQAGYDQVMEANNGKEGLEYYLRNKPDLIITDIRMPNMDGIEFLKKVRKRDPSTPIIIISGFFSKEISSLDEVTKLGANGVIDKPFNISELIKAVKKLD